MLKLLLLKRIRLNIVNLLILLLLCRAGACACDMGTWDLTQEITENYAQKKNNNNNKYTHKFLKIKSTLSWLLETI